MSSIRDQRQGRPRIEIAASRDIATPPESLFTFLSDLENHWRVTGPAVSIEKLDGPAGARNGGRVRLRGPLFLQRSCRTRVLESRSPHWMMGSAEVGRRTRALVSWSLTEVPNGTRVRLRAEVLSLGALDRLLLRLGGRRWMQGVFERTVLALAEQAAPHRATSDARASSWSRKPELAVVHGEGR